MVSVPSADVDRIVGRYSERLLRTRAEQIAATEAHDAFSAGRDQVYEQLVADHRGTVTAVLEHLGHTGVEVPPPPIERQADDLNRERAERFRREEGLQ